MLVDFIVIALAVLTFFFSTSTDSTPSYGM